MHGGRRTRARGSSGHRQRVTLQPQEIVPEIRVFERGDDNLPETMTFSGLTNQFSGRNFADPEQRAALAAFGGFSHLDNRRYSFHLTFNQSADGGRPSVTRLVINMVANTNTGNMEVVKVGTAPALPNEASVRTIVTRLSRFGISLTGGWSNDEERRAVLMSMGRLSDSELSVIRDIHLARASVAPRGPGHEDANGIGGHYRQTDHLIRVFNKGFENGGTLRALGEDVADLLPGVAQAILHEVGHALAYSEIRQAGLRDRQARQDLDAAIRTMRSRWPQYWSETRSGGQTNYQWRQPRGVPSSERGQYRTDLSTYQQADRDARTANDAYADMEQSEVMTNFRRTAARQAPLTEYARTSLARGSTPAAQRTGWEEFFAEAFAIYKWDPDWLRNNRRPLYNFFDQGRHLYRP